MTATAQGNRIAHSDALRPTEPPSPSLPPRPVSTAARLVHTVAATWRASQVELAGKYSVERMLDLAIYSRTVPPLRVLYLFFLTIAPCLVAIIVLEAIPLAPISLGIHGSRNFWFRTFLGTYMVTHSLVAQYRHNVATLALSSRQTMVISLATAVILTPILYGVCYALGYPLPFFVAASMVPWSPIVMALAGSMLREQLRHDPNILPALKKYTVVFHSQTLLILVYPAYSYVFNSYPSSQTPMAMLLPVIKLLFKNWFGYSTRHIEDMKPELVVFNVEIFSALYVSACMQNATSVSTTLVIMAVDFVQACMSIKDLNDVLDDKELRKALGDTADCRVLVPLATYILQAQPSLMRHASIRFQSSAPALKRIDLRTVKKNQVVHATPAPSSSTPPSLLIETAKPPQLQAAVQSLEQTDPPPSQAALAILQRCAEAAPPTPDVVALAARLDERAQLLVVQKTLQILHIAEFVALIEYAEVFVPIVYSLFCVIAYTFPNGQFYSTLSGLSPAKFVGTLFNVLAYGSLELVSYVALDVVMRRKFRLSAFKQTAFVLETQWDMVQSKLTLWMLVVLQFSLQHFGSDFSFQFAWLKDQPP